MAIKKAKFKPPVYDAQGAVSYPHTVHLETSADMVKYNDSNVASELSNLSTETKLKISTVDKELNDYQKTLAQVNVNQEAKQSVSGYGVVSLPKTAANGQVSAVVKGNTRTNIAPTSEIAYEQGRIRTDGVLVAESFWIRTKDYITLQPNTQYIISVANLYKVVISEYKIDGTFIQNSVSGSSVTITTNSNTAKVKINLFTIDSSNILPSNITSIKPLLETGNIAHSFIAGTKSTISAGRLKSVSADQTQESFQYFSAKDSNGNIVELRSLPNGTKDEVRVSEGKKYQRTNEKILQSSDITDMVTYDGVDYARIIKPNDYVFNNTTNAINGTAGLESYSEDVFGTTSDKIGKFVHISTIRFAVGFQKGTTLEQARTALVGKSLIYQLATPIEIPIEVSGTLLSYPSGTIYVENAVADAGVYTDKFTILQQDLPIKEIEKISKVDFTTGVETQLDITKAVIAGDKKSFTHPNLTANDIVFTTYFFDKESTLGEMSIEYYDSRHVLKDSVTGKFYKVVPTVANGVLTNGLVEV